MSKSILYTTVWRKWIEYCPPSLMHIHTPAHTQPYIYTHTFRWFVLFATSVGVRKNTRWRSSWSGSLEGLITNNPTTLLSPPFLLLSLSFSLSRSLSLSFSPSWPSQNPPSSLLPPPPSPPLRSLNNFRRSEEAYAQHLASGSWKKDIKNWLKK